MTFVRVAMVGCAFLLTAALSGCGSDATTGDRLPTDDPNAGVEASKSIMQMQPPAPAGQKGKQSKKH